MKIDLYTKGILTVIALSLVVMAFKDADPIHKASAHDGVSYDEMMYAISLEGYTKERDVKNIIKRDVKNIIKDYFNSQNCSVMITGTMGVITCR